MRLKIVNFFQIVKPKSETINNLKVIIIKKNNHDYISYIPCYNEEITIGKQIDELKVIFLLSK